jgi:hypothetical protein
METVRLSSTTRAAAACAPIAAANSQGRTTATKDLLTVRLPFSRLGPVAAILR